MCWSGHLCDSSGPLFLPAYLPYFLSYRLFTLNGSLLNNSKDLQDNHFYVAVGLETFKHFAYWKSPKVPSEVQR